MKTAREIAHAILERLREPWACGGGDHSKRCDRTTDAIEQARDEALAEALQIIEALPGQIPEASDAYEAISALRTRT